MNEPPHKFWASAESNGDFFVVETRSGYRSCAYDPEGAQHFLPPNVNDDTLGGALRDALARSRRLTLEELPVFFALENLKQRYETYVSETMSRYGYKTRRALFRNMMHCSVEMQEGVITIRPSRHEKLEGWSGDGISESDRVKLPAYCTDAELGRGLRLAFSRCWPKTPWVKQLMAAFEDPAQGA